MLKHHEGTTVFPSFVGYWSLPESYTLADKYQFVVCLHLWLEEEGDSWREVRWKQAFLKINQLVILGHRSPHPYSLLQFFIKLTYCLTTQADGKDKLSIFSNLLAIQFADQQAQQQASISPVQLLCWKDREGQDNPINTPTPTPQVSILQFMN